MSSVIRTGMEREVKRRRRLSVALSICEMVCVRRDDIVFHGEASSL